jgi:hypothetical protein
LFFFDVFDLTLFFLLLLLLLIFFVFEVSGK